ncbi:MAG: 50S ribosomal protein L36 [bacterium]
MKKKASVKIRCEHCYSVKRRDGKGKKRLKVYCKRNRRHNQTQ